MGEQPAPNSLITSGEEPGHVLSVAAHILHLAARDGIEMTTDKLQILCYHVQGWMLAYCGRPAFTQQIYSIEGRLSIEEISETFKTFGEEPFTLKDALGAGIITDPAAANADTAGQL